MVDLAIENRRARSDVLVVDGQALGEGVNIIVTRGIRHQAGRPWHESARGKPIAKQDDREERPELEGIVV